VLKEWSAEWKAELIGGALIGNLRHHNIFPACVCVRGEGTDESVHLDPKLFALDLS
jgi:hypothetical protein